MGIIDVELAERLVSSQNRVLELEEAVDESQTQTHSMRENYECLVGTSNNTALVMILSYVHRTHQQLIVIIIIRNNDNNKDNKNDLT